MRISSKLRWFILVLVLLISLSIALIGYFGNASIISDFQRETVKKRSDFEVDRLQLAFSELNHDIRFIARLPMVQELANLEPEQDSAMRHAKHDLASIFMQMLEAKPDYTQVRLIQAAQNGLECVRVDQRDGAIFRIPEDELQAKGHRDYFVQASQKKSGEIYHSKINLNQENGLVEYPARPVLRVAMPIYDDRHLLFGIVIINLNFKTFIERVLRLGLDRNRYAYYLLNQEGYFLYHPDSGFTFGFDLGFDLRAEHEFSELVGFSGSGEAARTFRMDALPGASRRLAQFTKFQVFEPVRELAFGVVASYDDIGRASIYTTLVIILVMCFLTACAVILAIWFSSQITQPLEQITAATQRLCTDEPELDSLALPIDREDEIGVLANSFKQMQVSVKQHQQQLERANDRLFDINRDLEHFARVASHDLREPIQRIAGLASLYQSVFENGESQEAEHVLGQLHDECDKALGQLADFREFTDISQDARLQREGCWIEDVVCSVIDEYSEQLEARGVQVDIAPLPQLSVYPSLVRVLYRNLVDNALKHVKVDGFHLEFTCEAAPSGHFVLGLRNSDSSISEGNAKRVFDLFSRLDEGLMGHGVGLAICKRIVNFHAGRIWVEPELNHVHIKFNLTEDS
jgi:signal transduction histidine kinase